jgi:hypothetical protein
LPKGRVHKVAIRLLSLQSVVRKTRASAFSAAISLLLLTEKEFPTDFVHGLRAGINAARKAKKAMATKNTTRHKNEESML